MRSIAFLGVMALLLPMALVRPFVGVLLWCWFSFMNPHRLFWGPVAELPWAAIIFVVTFAGIILSPEARRAQFNAMSWLVVVFMVGITITSVTALGPPGQVWAKWDLVFKMCLGLLLTAVLLSDRERIHALIWVIVISLGYYGVKGGLFTIAHAGYFRVHGPADSMIGDNNHLAVALLVSIPLMNYLRLQSAHASVRWGLAAAMPLTLMAALGSHSRGAFLALMAGALVFWARSRGKFVMGAVLAAAVAAGISFMPERWEQRMNTISTYEEDTSATDRLLLWRTAFDLAVDRPLLGVGFRGPYVREVVDRVNPDAPARAVHSIWFELLAEQGFVVFLVWLTILALGAWYAWKLPRLCRHVPELSWAIDLGRMALVSIAVYAVGGTFLSLSYWDGFLTLLMALAAAHALVRQAVKQPAHLPRAAVSRARRGFPEQRALT